MAIFDLLGRNWAMGVLWTLSKGGPCTFRELRSRCEMISPSVLNSRLKELREAGLVEHSTHGYSATPIGYELYEFLIPLGAWAKRWSVTLDDHKDSE